MTANSFVSMTLLCLARYEPSGRHARHQDPIEVVPLPVEMPAYTVRHHWHERYHHDPWPGCLRADVSKLFRE